MTRSTPLVGALLTLTLSGGKPVLAETPPTPPTVLTHYADLAEAKYSDALTAANALRAPLGGHAVTGRPDRARDATLSVATAGTSKRPRPRRTASGRGLHRRWPTPRRGRSWSRSSTT